VEGANLLVTLALIFSLALLLGTIAQRLRLSPIVGYLLTGVILGPYTPGIVVDPRLAAQLADIGIILLMFGVGLRFRLADLWNVRRVSLPGAVIQCALATGFGTLTVAAFGWDWSAGLVVGLAISVCSTVVMTRALLDNRLLDSPQGHVAVGWAITEDLVTVLAMVLLPVIAPGAAATPGWSLAGSAGLALGKVLLMAALLLAVGTRLVPWLLAAVARSRSSELFTLAVLVVALGTAAVAHGAFGGSLALSAFLAGVVVGHSRLSLQAAADALPLRDAFAVLFFVSVAMLFDPHFVVAHPGLTAATVGLIMLWKPIGAFAVATVLGASARSALTVALCLAQIGEFSFILAQSAGALKILPAEGHSLLVSAALISITANSLLVRSLSPLELWLRRRPRLWRLLGRRSEARAAGLGRAPAAGGRGPEAIVVGYGPAGRAVTRVLRALGLETVVLELNPDTVSELAAAGEPVMYGDAGRREVLAAAGAERARCIVVTLPDLPGRAAILATARLLNPDIRIITRARYLQERELLEEMGANTMCFEEAEAAAALARAVLEDTGAPREAAEREARSIREGLTGGPVRPAEPGGPGGPSGPSGPSGPGGPGGAGGATG